MAHDSRARVAGETASASNEVRLQQVRSVPRAASAGASCRGLSSHDRQSVGRREAALRAVGAGRPAAPRSEVDYKRFNSSNISIRHWSWNYRSCFFEVHYIFRTFFNYSGGLIRYFNHDIMVLLWLAVVDVYFWKK